MADQIKEVGVSEINRKKAGWGRRRRGGTYMMLF